MRRHEEKTPSKGEFNAVLKAVGGLENLLDEKCKYKELYALVQYLSEDDKLEKVFENQQIIKTPVVRNGKLATVGFQPDVWKEWE